MTGKQHIVTTARKGIRAGAVVAVAATVFALTACDTSGSGVNSGSSGGSVSISEFEMDHLTPGWGSGYNNDAVNALFSPLVTFDTDNNLKLVQAESITTPDNKVWTVKIKPGWTFHNGEEVTAQSFLDGLNTAAYGPNAWSQNYQLTNIEGYDELNPTTGQPTSKTMSGLKVIDPQTFEVTLKAPDSQLEIEMTGGYTAWSPLPKSALSDLAAYDKAPIGNGPFQMEGTWENPSSNVKVKAFGGYKGTKPKVNSIEFKTYSSADTAYTDLLAGNIDLNGTFTKPPSTKLAQAKSDFSGRVVTSQQVYPSWIGFPHGDQRFTDIRVRQAISMAIDRNAIVSKIYGGLYTPATGLLAAGTVGGGTDSCGESCKFDPAKAKALLAAAGGWSGPLEIQYITGKGDEPYVQALANNIRQNLGISDVVLTGLLSSEYEASLKTGPKGLFLTAWSSTTPTPLDILAGAFQKGSSYNPRSAFYENATVDSLLEQAKRTKSSQEATDLFHKAEAQVMKDLPVTPVYVLQGVTAYSDRIEKPMVNLNGLILDQIALK